MTRREERALVIVGGGLAGLAAAAEASRAGLETTLVEQRQTVRGPRRLVAEAAATGAEIRVETTAWGIWGRDVALWGPASGASVITAEQLILATGSFERPIAFPGWTLPGVMTAGGARRLLEQGVPPGQRVLVAGSGRWVTSAASDLRAGRVNVVDVVDATSRSGRIVIRAEGDQSVERVLVARATRGGSVREGQVQVVDVDALVLAWGLLPENQLARLAGCQHSGSTYLAPTTDRDDWMRTSVRGVLVAGDGGGIVGPDAAVEQGRLGGLAASLDSGRLSQRAADTRAQAARRRLAAVAAPDSFPVGLHAGLLALAEPDTLICRCEDVTLRNLSERLFEGSSDPGPAIAETRAAMGLCQGRHCASLVAAVISRQPGVPFDRVGPVTPRPPVVPVPLGALAERPPEFEPLRT